MNIQDREIIPKQAVRLSELVVRLTAPNAGVMTGPGTNTYLVGKDDITVIDPGPLIDSHVEKILQVAGKRLKRVICTHTHPDHSPAGTPVAKAANVPLIGTPIENDGYQDLTFKPTSELTHRQVVTTNEYNLDVIHTPGHVGNHYCLLLREENILFAGDHLMTGTTVVIVPPYGDMSEYIQSLEILKNYPVDFIAPAHGGLIPDAIQVLDDTIVHRLKREAKVLKSLTERDRSTVDELIPLVYSDVNPNLFKLAQWSLLAHLLKLQKDNKTQNYVDDFGVLDRQLYLNSFDNGDVFSKHRWRIIAGTSN